MPDQDPAVASINAMVTHRLRLESARKVDKEVICRPKKGFDSAA